MPKDLTEKEISDIESNDEGDIPASEKRDDEEAEEQVSGELMDEIEDTQTKQDDENEDKDKDADKDGDRDKDEDEDEDDDDGDDEVPEGEYEVEAIRDHKVITKGTKKTFLLYIKWKGFPEEDNTWEPEANLNEVSKKLMEAYFRSIGGRPDLATRTDLKKRKSSSSLPDQPISAKKSKRNGSSETLSTWTPVSKNWELDIERVDTVDRDPDTKKLNAYIIFKNGKRVKVGMEMVHKHCPRAMLKFYEEHLKFT